jgi:hypothetical protein
MMREAVTAAAPTNGHRHATPGPSGAALRRLPYPYRALVAICSDLDETPDRDVYRETMRFLNTTETTRMGTGVGLEVGNSIYFDMPPDQFAYWNTDEAGRRLFQDLVRSGHVDCFHSFGDLAATRAHAGRALDELARHGCRLDVWVDHAVAPTNFGGDIMQGSGDLPGAPAYHADLTCDFGVRFVWRGRVTSVIGQDVRRRLRGLYRSRHPVASGQTVARELAKVVLARLGNRKYALHGPNEVLRPERLRDGRPVWEFLRANPHWAGVSCGETANGFASVVTESLLDRLVAREGVCLLYTHLGKVTSRQEPFGAETRRALRLLARYRDEGRVLVTTTRRLLGHCRAIREIKLSTATVGGEAVVDVSVPAHAGWRPGDLDGVTLYVPEPSRTRVTVAGREVTELCRNGPDQTGRPSVSFPWPRLEFPAL